MIQKVYIIIICVFSPYLFSSPSNTSAEDAEKITQLKKQIESTSASLPEKPGHDSTDEDWNTWRDQDYKVRQARIEMIESLELFGLPEDEMKQYYVMKLDDIESCFYHARLKANQFKAKLYPMMHNSGSVGKILARELFWNLNIYHINTHLMHISEEDLQQIADIELSRKDSPEAGRLMVMAIERARPGPDAKVKWSTWVFDNMPPESEGHQRLSSHRRKTDILREFEFEYVDLNGNTITGESLWGKVVLVDFWAFWCGFCLQELPAKQKLHDKYKDQEFCILGVFNDHRIDQLKEYLKSNNITWIQLVYPEAKKESYMHPLAQRYGISALPYYLLIDKEGKLVKFAGRLEYLESDIERLLTSNNNQTR